MKAGESYSCRLFVFKQPYLYLKPVTNLSLEKTVFLRMSDLVLHISTYKAKKEEIKMGNC